MNLVGKIFTVLIFVMSLLFMSFAVAVYATHKNWKEVVTNPQAAPGKPKGLAHQLKDAKSRNQELNDQKAKLEDDLAKEKKADEQARSKQESEYALLEQEFNRLQKERQDLLKQASVAAGAMAATQATLKDLRDEIYGPDRKSGLRGDIQRTNQEKDDLHKQVVRLTDQLHQLAIEKKRLEARAFELGKDKAKALDVLRKFGLKAEPQIYEDVPPEVWGVVLAVTGEGPDLLVEISLGEDDGLRKGHKLHVYRVSGPPPYVGDVEVLQTYPDKAVCRVVNTLNSPMRRGDRVASRLR